MSSIFFKKAKIILPEKYTNRKGFIIKFKYFNKYAKILFPKYSNHG